MVKGSRRAPKTEPVKDTAPAPEPEKKPETAPAPEPAKLTRRGRIKDREQGK